MVDPGVLVRKWLLANASVTSLLGVQTGQIANSGGIFRGDLPEQFDPTLGPGIQIQQAGGPGHAEIVRLVNPRLMIRVWAEPNKQTAAWAVFRAVYDVMHGATMVDIATAGRVLTCLAENTGQDGGDPGTGWVTVTGFFVLQLAQTL